MEDFKGITQETADELLRSFQEFNEASEGFCAAFDASMKAYMDACQQAAAMKFVEYMHKYASGTFLTRWYWLRKARKCDEVFQRINSFNEEYLKH